LGTVVNTRWIFFIYYSSKYTLGLLAKSTFSMCTLSVHDRFQFFFPFGAFQLESDI